MTAIATQPQETEISRKISTLFRSRWVEPTRALSVWYIRRDGWLKYQVSRKVLGEVRDEDLGNTRLVVVGCLVREVEER